MFYHTSFVNFVVLKMFCSFHYLFELVLMHSMISFAKLSGSDSMLVDVLMKRSDLDTSEKAG